MVTCLDNEHASIFEFGQHSSPAATPASKKLTFRHKAFCRDLAEQHLRPIRTRHALARKFGAPLEELPALKTELAAWIRDHAYTGREGMAEPFTFAWHMDNQGKPIIGNGSGKRPFLVGISTKALLLRLSEAPESFILHLDGTYKTNQIDYPVLVIGVSDRSRRFHLVALFVMSQETQPIFQAALITLRRVYGWVTDKYLSVCYAMVDADRAQYNALAAVFGDSPKYQFLMCFFHVMKHIQERVKILSSGAQARVLRAIRSTFRAELLRVYRDAETNLVGVDEGSDLSSVRTVYTRAMADGPLHSVAGVYDAEWVRIHEQSRGNIQRAL
eukprot:jgi/Phyca11/104701/e_gw1.9.628.1